MKITSMVLLGLCLFSCRVVDRPGQASSQVAPAPQPDILSAKTGESGSYAVFHSAAPATDTFRVRLPSKDWKVMSDKILQNLPVKAPQLLLDNDEAETEAWIRTFPAGDMATEVRLIRMRKSLEVDGCKTSFLELFSHVAFSYECVSVTDDHGFGGERGRVVGVTLPGEHGPLSVIVECKQPVWAELSDGADVIASSVELVR